MDTLCIKPRCKMINNNKSSKDNEETFYPVLTQNAKNSEIFTRWLRREQAQGVPGAWVVLKTWVRCFCIPTTCECKKFKFFRLQQVGFEFPHHLRVSPPLNLQSKNDKITFVGASYLPTFWGRIRKQPFKWLSDRPTRRRHVKYSPDLLAC